METARAKLINAILFFARNTHHCSKRKLLLLLYFLDFEHSRRTGRSITEQRYSAWGCGPIPDRLLLELDEPREDLNAAVGFSGNPEWDYFLYTLSPKRPLDLKRFTPVEQAVLNAVATSWRNSYPAELEEKAKEQGGPWHRVWQDGKGRFEPVPLAPGAAENCARSQFVPESVATGQRPADSEQTGTGAERGMSEIRQNPITRDWVIIASQRTKRPNEFARPHAEKTPLPAYDPACPFCPGNEEDDELCRLEGDQQEWRIRVVSNKYPALSPLGERKRIIEGIHRAMPGVGMHEVIIEHPRHDLTTAQLAPDDVADLLRVYRQRYAMVRQDPRVETILIFKNHGKRAGTSLRHPHSQLAATPIVPNEIRRRAEEAIRFYDDTGECIFCHTLRQELAAQERIVVEREHIVAFVPYAAISPFHIWIFPRRHASSFEQISDVEIVDLAHVLRLLLAKLHYGLGDPDYNYVVRSIPTYDGQTSYFHWYLSIIPRVSRTAGFELGSGMFINPTKPEESASFLRRVHVPS
jgi:UDPglucose--hexose-1-phosphate uridylyltransferase